MFHVLCVTCHLPSVTADNRRTSQHKDCQGVNSVKIQADKKKCENMPKFKKVHEKIHKSAKKFTKGYIIG